MEKPPKIKDLLKRVHKHLEEGKYLFMGHAQIRLQERNVTRQEVRQALKNGYHEKRKDEFNQEYNRWNYSVRGKTLDKRNLRIALSFDHNSMLVITVIDLDK